MIRDGSGRLSAALWVLITLTPGSVAGTEPNAADASALSGVWRGTIGAREIAVCFDGPLQDGAYYGLCHPRRITLHPQPDGTWQAVADDAPPDDAPPDGAADEGEDCDGPCDKCPEDPGTGTWHLGSPADGQLTGRSTDAQTGQELPISLERQFLLSEVNAPSAPGGAHCANPVFTAPFAASTRVVIGERRTFAGRSYRTRTVSVADGLQISGIELLEPGAYSAAISRALRGHSETDAETAIELYSCQEGSGGGMSVNHAIEFWSERWLVTTEFTLDECGYRSYGSSTHRTWDLERGEAVNLAEWIDDWPRLQRLLLVRALSAPELAAQAARLGPRGRDDSCAAILVVEPPPWTSAYLGLNGMVFETELPQMWHGCDQAVEIPYPELLPFATDTGRKEILDILATLPTLPPPPPVHSPAAAMP